MVGKQAPDFSLQDNNGNEFHLRDLRGTKVMLVFYPMDNSIVCTKQLCEYNNNYDEYTNKGIQIVGISVDNIDSHEKFSKKYGFNFPLLSDDDKRVSNMYNALSWIGRSERKIVIIDEDGMIVYENTNLPMFYTSSTEILGLSLIISSKE